jgi:hypothetical protein
MRREGARHGVAAKPQHLLIFDPMEAVMMRSVIVWTVLTILTPAAHAQDNENGRYTFSQVADGMLRLDTRTGQVSLSAKKDTGSACNAVPDERQALESEITRLQRENGALKKDMLARGLPLPSGVARAPASQRELNLTVPLPSDAEIDRVMSALEKMWRRLMDMVQRTPGSDKI